MRHSLGLLLPLLLLLLARPAPADVLVLADGRRIEGTIVRETTAEVEIRTAFGTFGFKRSEIVEIERGKTREELYGERLAACETAEDFYRLGLWCEENRLKRRAEKIFSRAIEVDPQHEGARLKLGFVRYGGRWMTPAERDRRQAEDFAAEMRAKGLVEHAGEWVTPEEKRKLERGLVLLGGRWMPKADAMRAQGLEELDGHWYPREEVLARRSLAGLRAATGLELSSHITREALLVGTVDRAVLERIGRGLDLGRGWFNRAFGVEPGLRLFGNRPAELYVFGDANAPYLASVDFVAARSDYIPEGWKDSVKRTYGFTWIDPIPISSARQWNRDQVDVVGHSYHHFGHLVSGRLGYSGRLLPPWYEEGIASLMELRIHRENRVFCRSGLVAYGGTRSNTDQPEFDDNVMRDGSWRSALARAVRQGRIEPFDKLAQLDFSALTLVDIATSMAILEWMEGKGGSTLATFHKALRKGAPPAPLRVIRSGHERQAYFDRAFEAAVGVGFRQADAEWRRWLLSR